MNFHANMLLTKIDESRKFSSYLRGLNMRCFQLTVTLTIRVLLLLTLSFGMSGCLAPYDQASDNSISEIHKKLDVHIDSVSKSDNGSAAARPNSDDFYVALRSDIRSLKLRTESRGSDPSLKTQAALLDQLIIQVDAVENLERSNLRGQAAWQTARDGLSTNFKGFLTSELARK